MLRVLCSAHVGMQPLLLLRLKHGNENWKSATKAAVSETHIPSGKLFRSHAIHIETLACGTVSCFSWRSRHLYLVRGFALELQTPEVDALHVAVRVGRQFTLLQVLPELCLPATRTVFQRRQTEHINFVPLHPLMQEVQANIMGYQPACANRVIW